VRRGGGTNRVSFCFASRRAKDGRHAFTLIELLVVIAIISVLAALLFRFRDRPAPSRETSCLSNLRQIGMSISNVRQDNAASIPTP